MELTLEYVLSKLEEAEDVGIISDIYNIYRDEFVGLEKFTGFKVTPKKGNRIKSESDYDIHQLVYKITSEDKVLLIAIDGYYSSYEGTDFSNGVWYEVKEVEKTIKVYEKI
jgi:hypothetical protein